MTIPGMGNQGENCGNRVMSQETLSVRHLAVDLSQGFPRYWNGGDAYRTHLFNSLSLLFPQGERGFIESVRSCVPLLPEQGFGTLREDVRLFIGQEASHGHLHRQMNDELVRQGYRSLFEDHLKRNVDFSIRSMPPRLHLAMTVAYEHFTATLGDGLLRREAWTRDMTQPMRQLWRWHAAEETEHKAVAFDTFRALGGGWSLRAFAFVYAFIELNVMINVQSASMLWHDGKLFSPRTWWSALTMWWGRDGIVWHALPRILMFIKPGFHPWQDDNRDLLLRWRAASVGQYRVIRSTAPDGT